MLVNVPTLRYYQEILLNLKVYIHDFNCNIHICSFISFEFNAMSYCGVMTQCGVMADRGGFVKVISAELDQLSFFLYFTNVFC